jgi:hypothetical protein
VRSRRSEWARQDPEDVAWVAEWQLLAAAPWAPLDDERPVTAEPQPEPGDRWWGVTVTIGSASHRVLLPVRDLGKLIAWCHGVTFPSELARLPAGIRASAMGIRAALRKGLSTANPLKEMGYAPPEAGLSGG